VVTGGSIQIFFFFGGGGRSWRRGGWEGMSPYPPPQKFFFDFGSQNGDLWCILGAVLCSSAKTLRGQKDTLAQVFCLSVSVKWLAVKTASEMTYTVSGGALNSTQTKTKPRYIFIGGGQSPPSPPPPGSTPWLVSRCALVWMLSDSVLLQ